MVLLLLTLKQHDSLERQATYLMSLWNPDETLMSHRTSHHRSVGIKIHASGEDCRRDVRHTSDGIARYRSKSFLV